VWGGENDEVEGRRRWEEGRGNTEREAEEEEEEEEDEEEEGINI
jgi:hypothetical protein